MPPLSTLEQPKTPRIVTDIVPWRWGDDLAYSHNIAAISNVLPRLETVRVAVLPATEELFVMGPDNISYSTVSPAAVNSRANSLRQLYMRGARVPYLALSDHNEKMRSAAYIKEEARVRQLCLSLGVACLRQAIHAQSSADFQRSVADATQVLHMPRHSIATVREFDVEDSGRTILYALKLAAKRHKVLSPAEATGLADGIANIGHDGTSWHTKEGRGYANVIGYYKPAPKSAELVTTTMGRENLRLLSQRYRPTSHRTLVYDPSISKEPNSPFRSFARHYLFYNNHHAWPEEQLAELHATYVGKDSEPFPKVSHAEQKSAIFLGILAYLRASRGNSIADKLEDSLEPFGIKTLLPVLILGNLLAAKINHDPDMAKKLERGLPGVKDEAVEECFATIRDAVYTARGEKEPRVVKMLGDLVAAYIKQALPQK